MPYSASLILLKPMTLQEFYNMVPWKEHAIDAEIVEDSFSDTGESLVAGSVHSDRCWMRITPADTEEAIQDYESSELDILPTEPLEFWYMSMPHDLGIITKMLSFVVDYKWLWVDLNDDPSGAILPGPELASVVRQQRKDEGLE